MKPSAQNYKRATSVHRNGRPATSSDLWPITKPTESSNTENTQQCSYSGPITYLPTELLAQIFEYCLSEEAFPAPATSQAPLLLAHTCSHWRAVALSTPSLWSRLHITYKDPSLDVPSAAEWLQRSGNLPLSISVFIDFNEQSAQEILDVICAHSTRWQYVRFEFRGLYCPPMYSLALAEGNIPNLHAFEFSARDISSANITPIISLLNSAPSLREVTWVDDLADTRRLLELPLSRLTLLSITMSHGTLDYLELLNQCYNLEHIRITRPRQGDTRPSREPLRLSKLTSLNIAYDLTALLDSLVLPALKHVRIHSQGQTGRSTGRGLGAGAGTVGGQASGTWSPVSFLSLIERSSCAIESLWVDAPISESCLADCLEKTSASLTKMTVAGVAITDHLVSGLTCPSTSSSLLILPEETLSALPPASFEYSIPLCPFLHEINFDTHISSAPGALLRMAESRISSLRSIGGFSLRVWDSHRDVESLKSLRDQHQHPLCHFRLDVVSPPRDSLFRPSGSSSRSRTRRYLSVKRRTCESR